ncbi:MAG: NnrS family protein [Xanthobacteraceae bacterium]
MTTAPTAGARRDHPLLAEGLMLFFPAAALHAMLSPLAWVTLFGLALPFAHAVPSTQWHAHEMIFGTYGAALAGFLTSAVPEWTDTPPRKGRTLIVLLSLWLPGRIVGLFGLEPLLALAGLTDFAFLSMLFWFVLSPLVERRSTRHASFAVWAGLFALTEAGIRIAWLTGQFDLAGRLLQASLYIFLVFFALAVARINVVVINLALDPSGNTTPYRPHPGRQNLAAGMVATYAAVALAFPQSQVACYLALAAAAAFFDRLAEWFIGTAVLRTQVLALAGANAFAGGGFLLIGLAGLGAPVAIGSGIHMLAVGSLGLAVMAVLAIAGLRHTGRPLLLPRAAHLAIALMACAGLVRVLPELGIGGSLAGLHYTVAALLWSAAFGVWFAGFMPLLLKPLRADEGCR